jgi:hypothetical protein
VALERELYEAVEQLPKRTPEASKTLDYMLVAVKLGIVSSGHSHPDPGRSHASGVRAVRSSPSGDLLTASDEDGGRAAGSPPGQSRAREAPRALLAAAYELQSRLHNILCTASSRTTCSRPRRGSRMPRPRARRMWLDSDLLQSALSATGGEASLRVNGAVDLRGRFIRFGTSPQRCLTPNLQDFSCLWAVKDSNLRPWD